MREKLKEIISKVGIDPSANPGFTLVYQRGHDLSGITRFEMRENGSFTLKSENPSQQSSAFFKGKLEKRQLNSILTAIQESRLLDVPSSARNIADDELPVVVELSHDNLRHRLLIWADDALGNTKFHNFEMTLWALFKQLSNGKIDTNLPG